jgi:hypothetical protein
VTDQREATCATVESAVPRERIERTLFPAVPAWQHGAQPEAIAHIVVPMAGCCSRSRQSLPSMLSHGQARVPTGMFQGHMRSLGRSTTLQGFRLDCHREIQWSHNAAGFRPDRRNETG